MPRLRGQSWGSPTTFDKNPPPGTWTRLPGDATQRAVGRRLATGRLVAKGAQPRPQPGASRTRSLWPGALPLERPHLTPRERAPRLRCQTRLLPASSPAPCPRRTLWGQGSERDWRTGGRAPVWTEEGRRPLSSSGPAGRGAEGVCGAPVTVCARVRVPRAGDGQHGDPGIRCPRGPAPGRNSLGCLGEKLRCKSTTEPTRRRLLQAPTARARGRRAGLRGD